MLVKAAGLGQVDAEPSPMQLSDLSLQGWMDTRGHGDTPLIKGTCGHARQPACSGQNGGGVYGPLPGTAALPWQPPCRPAVLPRTNIPSLPATANIVAGQTVNQPPLFECCWQPRLVRLLFNGPPVVYPGATH